jgi:hypothetical protein
MDDGYLGNARLKRVGVELSYTEEQLKEIVKCTEDPVYFIRNYVKIVNVDRGLVPFEMWDFQEEHGATSFMIIVLSLQRCHAR